MLSASAAATASQCRRGMFPKGSAQGMLSASAPATASLHVLLCCDAIRRARNGIQLQCRRGMFPNGVGAGHAQRQRCGHGIVSRPYVLGCSKALPKQNSIAVSAWDVAEEVGASRA